MAFIGPEFTGNCARVPSITISGMNAKATGLVPMAFVADVQRSIDFYALLGLELRDTFHNPKGQLVWAYVKCEGAELMFSLASDPVVPSQQAVLFYLYCKDLVALRDHLMTHGVKAVPSAIPGTCPRERRALKIPTAMSC